MIHFTNPMWLWALTGLLIPLGIHLLSRKEGKMIEIGSLRHLVESNTAQFQSIRINEIVLLMLRSLLITVIVLLLAGFQINTNKFSTNRWLVIENGIQLEKDIKPLMDSLVQQGYEMRFLAKNFPSINDSLKLPTPKDYWGLTEKLSGSGDIVVISYNYAEGFKGKRAAMPSNIKWITYNPKLENNVAKIVSLLDDSVWIREATATAERTAFETKSLPMIEDSVIVEKNDSITIRIFFEEAFEYDTKILVASLTALQEAIPYKLIIKSAPVKEFVNENSDWIIWLSEDKIPETHNTKIIIHGSCKGNNLPLIVSAPDAKFLCKNLNTATWVITKRLTEESALKENLTLKLASIVLVNMESNGREEKDKRVLSESLMWSSFQKQSSFHFSKQSLASVDQYLVILLFLLLLSERWLAYKRNQ